MGVDDRAVPGNEHSVLPAGGQHRLEGGRPRHQVRIGVDDRITGLLDKVTAEHHRVPIGHRHDQVVRGVTTARVTDAHAPAAEIDVAPDTGRAGTRIDAIARSTSPASAP